jgi:hypothetical protein
MIAGLGMIAHFASSSGIWMKSVIELCSLDVTNSKPNMAEVVALVLAMYDVEDCLHCVESDDASNSDTLLW